MSASKPSRTIRQEQDQDEENVAATIAAASFLTEMRNNNDEVCSTTQQHDQHQQNQQHQHDLTTKKANQKSTFKTRKKIIRRRFVLPTKTSAANKTTACHHQNPHQEEQRQEDEPQAVDEQAEQQKINRQTLTSTETQQHQRDEQVMYCDSYSVERIGHPKNRSDPCSSSVAAAAALLLINTAATTTNHEDQHRVVPNNQKPRLPSEELHVATMRAAQSVYYQRMLESNARHQQGHFAMMFPQQQEAAAPATMITDQEPIRQQQLLLPQPQHASDTSFNSGKRQLSPTPTNPAAGNVVPPRVVGHFYFAQEEELSGTTVPNLPTRFVDGINAQQLRHILTPQDRHLTTQFTASIIDQLDFVYFEDGDRRSHRTHLPVGFRGICCRYCKAPAGKCGRFFPSSLKTLSDTQKTLYTLHRHFIKCKHVPDDVKLMLHKLRENHMEERKTLKGHGSQRAFFRLIWAFLCPDAEGGSIAGNVFDNTKQAKEAKAL